MKDSPASSVIPTAPPTPPAPNPLSCLYKQKISERQRRELLDCKLSALGVGWGVSGFTLWRGEGISKGSPCRDGGKQASRATLRCMGGFCLDSRLASLPWARYGRLGKGCTEEAVVRLWTQMGWLELCAGQGLKGKREVWDGLPEVGAEGWKGQSHVPRQYP